MAARAAEESRKTAQAIATAINRKFGPGTVVIASEARVPPPRLSSGSLAFDVAWGGGFPVNQWTEIVGNESAGKTSVILQAIAARQRIDLDFTVLWVAAEAYDAEWAATNGVDNRRVWLIEENVMEIALASVLEYVENRACDMVVIDSVPALVPADEDAKGMDEWSPGTVARRLNQFMRKGTKATKRSAIEEDRPIVGVIVNQWREKIGVLHGDPRTTPGGKGKNFWMYARIEIRRDEWIIDPDTKEKVGQVIKAQVFKMKGAKPGPPSTVDYYFADSNGVTAGTYDVYKEILNLALYYDIVVRRGSGYVYEDTRHNGGKQGFYDALRADHGLYERVRKEVLDAARPEPEPEPVPRRALRRTP